MAQHYGVFAKNGFDDRTASSPAEAVQLAYDGWREKTPANAKTPTDAADNSGPTGSKTSK